MSKRKKISVGILVAILFIGSLLFTIPTKATACACDNIPLPTIILTQEATPTPEVSDEPTPTDAITPEITIEPTATPTASVTTPGNDTHGDGLSDGRSDGRSDGLCSKPPCVPQAPPATGRG